MALNWFEFLVGKIQYKKTIARECPLPHRKAVSAKLISANYLHLINHHAGSIEKKHIKKFEAKTRTKKPFNTGCY